MADTLFNFGMHAGKTFQHVFDNDKWYVSWALKQESCGAIKCKNGLLKRFVDFINASSGPASAAASPVATQQATQSECAKVPNHIMGVHPTMTPTPMAATQHHAMMAPQHHMRALQPHMMAPRMMAPQQQMSSQQYYEMQSQAMLIPCATPVKELDKGPRSDPTWCQVLDHLDERGIDFETVRDAHHDTRRDILKAVFYGDAILRAQAETMWLKL
mmetsp:Transcript_96433/g.281825  ORF Transcript_96433/g.281825 Transcript_96433/m.281825 type:complete len:215 (+) Transcript_96433:51-695(+)